MLACCARGILTTVWLTAASAVGLAVEDDDTPINETPVELSTVTVDTVREDPVKLDIPRDEWDWRAGRIGEIEFLTSAEPEETRRLLERFYEFTQLVEWIVPQWQRSPGRPLRLVLCGARDGFDVLRPVAAESNLRDAVTIYLPDVDGAYLVADLQVREIEVFETHGLTREGGFASLAGEEDDAESEEIPTLTMDSAGLPVQALEFMRRDYVRDLMASRGMRPPPWLSEGLAQLIATARIENGRVRIGRLNTTTIKTTSDGRTTDTGQISDLSLFFTRRALMPMLDLFAVGYDSPEYLNPVGSTFSGQSLAFVHYCLYGEKGRHQAAFMRWIEHLRSGPPTEEAFEASFGVSTRKMNLLLRGYFSGGRYQSPVTKAEPLPPMPEIELRAATPVEIARHKAQVHRLNGRLDEARAILDTARSRGFEDAPLLFTLGAVALGQNDFAAAREAFATGRSLATPDPISRLRATEVDVRSADAEEMNKATAKRCVVDLLAARAELAAPHPDVPRLLADVIRLGGLKPDAGFIALLEDGVTRFPDDLALRDAVTRCLTPLARPATTENK